MRILLFMQTYKFFVLIQHVLGSPSSHFFCIDGRTGAVETWICFLFSSVPPSGPIKTSRSWPFTSVRPEIGIETVDNRRQSRLQKKKKLG